ncbi:MAG: DUF885 family protein [Lachnospiraceae bacterium]|nr:DUF885 family protein [Lachnospiraceae bacterium]
MRKRMNKVGAVALSMTLAFGSLAACEKESKDPSQAETTTVFADLDETLNSVPRTDAETQKPTNEPIVISTEPTTPVQTEPTTSVQTEPTTPVQTEPTTLDQTEPAKDAPTAFADFCQEMAEYLIGDSYYTATTTIERPEKYGFTPDKLTNYCLASYKIPEGDNSEALEQERKMKAKLEAIDYNALTDGQKLTYDKLLYEFDIDGRLMKQKSFASPLDNQNGIMESVGTALYEFPFDEEADLIGYQKILETLPETFEDAIEYVKYQIKTLGYEPSDTMIADAEKYASDLTKKTDNPLLDAYDEKVNAMDLSADKKAEYIRKNREYVTGTLFDALKKFAEDVKQFDTETNEAKGLWAYEGGFNYYDVMLRGLLGVEMTPQEVFDYIESSLKQDIRRLTVYALTASNDLNNYFSGNITFPYDRNSVEEIAAYFTKALKQDFPMEILPAYTIENLPPALQIDGLGAYFIPPEWDDTSSRVIRLNPKAVGGSGGMSLDFNLVHEGFGGHMLQFECSADNDHVTSMFSELGYIEGWAMYAEYEAMKYCGLSDVMADLMAIETSSSYDICALADIGVNALGWSKDKLTEYLNTYGAGMIASELYSVVVSSPGSLLPYSFGPKKTKELIEEYKNMHADDLNVKEMHRKYMSIGSAAFEVVEKYFLGK